MIRDRSADGIGWARGERNVYPALPTSICSECGKRVPTRYTSPRVRPHGTLRGLCYGRRDRTVRVEGVFSFVV